jgi:DNA-directed RNA polymerase subunit RPC12/RpoP
MEKLELSSLKCTSCGANIKGFEGKQEISCDYCGTHNKILRPKEVLVSNTSLSEVNVDKLNNFIEILQKAMRAGNYNEGYDYCNKALEIDPNIGALWENKAICSFWLNINYINDDKIADTDAREIKTYLNASKENDPDSNTYIETADFIGYNLGLITKLKYVINIYKDVSDAQGNLFGFSREMCVKAKKYHELMETSFDIMENKDTTFLEFIVEDLSNLKSINWIELEKGNYVPSSMPVLMGYQVIKKRELLIELIKKHNNQYEAPKIKTTNNFPLWVKVFWILVIISFIIIIYNEASSK